MRRGLLSIEDKIDIVRRLRCKATIKYLASKYDVNEAKIRSVWADRKTIWKYNEVDQKLLTWYRRPYVRSDQLTVAMLEAKAVEIALKMNFPGFVKSVKWWVGKWLEKRNFPRVVGKRGRPSKGTASTPATATVTSHADEPVAGPSRKAVPFAKETASNPNPAVGTEDEPLAGPSWKTIRTAKGEKRYDHSEDIEFLLAKRQTPDGIYYLAKVKDVSDTMNRWEKGDYLDKKLIQEFEKKRGKWKEVVRDFLRMLEEGSPQLRLSGYSRGYELERIFGLTKISGGLFFIVKFRDLEELEVLPAEEVKERNKEEVITFYENRLYFKGGRDSCQYAGGGLDCVD